MLEPLQSTGEGGGCSFTVSRFPESSGFGRCRSVCSWAGAAGFKANLTSAMAEADRTLVFVLIVGDSMLPARYLYGKLVGAP